MKTVLIGIVLLKATCVVLPAQDAALPTLKLESRVVAVSAIVRGKKGDPAHGLTRDDFVLKQDGKLQAIRYFSEGSELPLTLALMVDTSGSQRAFIADETAASKVFFPQMLKRKEDRAVLVQFDVNVLRLHDMTNDVEALELALGHLAEPHGIAERNHGGGTLLYDAIVGTSRSVMGKEAGRRAMVLLTDGGDNGSSNDLQQAIGEALAADVVIYPIFYSAGAGMYGGRGLRVLAALADATGGQVFTVTKAHPLEAIYGQIEEAMRLQYQIGYVPPESKPGEFHRIDLAARDKKWVVSARKGYYAPEAPAASTGAAGTSNR